MFRSRSRTRATALRRVRFGSSGRTPGVSRQNRIRQRPMLLLSRERSLFSHCRVAVLNAMIAGKRDERRARSRGRSPPVSHRTEQRGKAGGNSRQEMALYQDPLGAQSTSARVDDYWRNFISRTNDTFVSRARIRDTAVTRWLRLSSVRILIERSMHHRLLHILYRARAGVEAKIEEMEGDGSRARLQFATSASARNYKYK